MSNEPDFDRLSEIAQRLEDAQDKPNYRDAFQKAVAEAEDACGEHQQFMEFLAAFTPTDAGEAPMRQRRAPAA